MNARALLTFAPMSVRANGTLLRQLGERSTALDRLTMGWIALFALGLIVFGRQDTSFAILLSTHIALLFLIPLIIVGWHDRTSGLSGFVRQLYPAILYSFFYREMQVANHWVFPRFLDSELASFERFLFGTDPNLWIIPAQSAWANEIMMLGYFSYYLLIPLVALPLYFQRRTAELRGMLLGMTTAFVISYLGFVLFPVEGPRYFFADRFTEPLAGFLFVPLVGTIIQHGAIHGGCMPSSHVAVALVALVWANKTMPSLGRALAPFVFILFVATAWGRFHYVTDVIMGFAVGVVALVLTRSCIWRRAVSFKLAPLPR